MGDEIRDSGWYYNRPGMPPEDHVGPFTWEQMVSQGQDGTLSPDDFVWHERLGDWRPAAEVTGLFAVAVPTIGAPMESQAPPPPPPPAQTTLVPPPPPPPSSYDTPQAPPPSSGYGVQPGYGAEPAPARRSPWIWIAPLIAVIVIAGALGGFFALRHGGDGGESGGEVFVQQEGEILLEPAGSAGPESFAGETFVPSGPTTTLNIPTSATVSTQAPTTTASAGEAQPVAVVAFPGDTPALYGGSKDKQVADKEAQLEFLAENPDKASAFCEALNGDPTLRWSGGSTVQTDQLPAYFDELTPMLLTRDIRVTNHGYRDGHPTPRQSVLQAGQLVLVDSYGVPRVRCECGNPLIPPKPVTKTPTYTGPGWPGFDPTTIIVIQQTNVIIENFVLVDINTGDMFVRPAGSGGSEDGPAPTTSTTATTEATTTTITSTTTTSETTGPSGPISSDELNGRWSGTMTITEMKVSEEAAQAAEAEGCSTALLESLMDQPLPMSMDITIDPSVTTGTAVMSLDVSALDPEGTSGLDSEPQTLTFTIQGDTLTFDVDDGQTPSTMVGVVRREGEALVMTGTMSSGDPVIFLMEAEWRVVKETK